MKDNQGVLGIFSYVDVTVDTVKKLKRAGFFKLRVFSPVPNHEIEEVMDEPESIVRFFTLFGAMLGAACGVGFTVLTSSDWPIQVSAKPIVSLPPFMVIIFELTILMGALATLLGLLVNSRLRRNAPRSMYDPRFSEDKFGVMVTCDKEHVKAVEAILSSQGAEEIKFDGV
jgi:molybdopterin-containing oxidoreductase family membrane subunit